MGVYFGRLLSVRDDCIAIRLDGVGEARCFNEELINIDRGHRMGLLISFFPTISITCKYLVASSCFMLGRIHPRLSIPNVPDGLGADVRFGEPHIFASKSRFHWL